MMRSRLNDILLDIIRCPETGSKLRFDGTSLYSDTGKVYLIQNKIPLLLSETESNIHYVTHYNKDAEEFDYFEEFDCKATEDDVNRLRQMILTEVPNNVKNILDVGSGGAWLAREMIAKRTPITSMDISFANVEKALKYNESDYHTGIVGDALNPPFKEKSFDCIVSSEVIEHTEDPKRFIQSLLPLLTDQGKLIISTPYKEKIIYDLCIHCNKKTPRNAHLHSFDEKKLADLSPKGFNAEHIIFGNKAMHLGRAYVITRYLSKSLWKLLDGMANSIIKKPGHIIVIYSRA